MTIYYKMIQMLLQIATAILLQSATSILRQTFITKYDSYYKMQLLLQIATVHGVIDVQ